MQSQIARADAVLALRSLLKAVPRRPDVWVRASENSQHLGAMLAEACLQAGLDYEAVVQPRIRRFLATYPHASTVTALRSLLASAPVATILGINNARKCGTLVALTELLHAEGVDTPEQFRAWLCRAEARDRLLAVKGVGVKTAAYLRLLAGLPAIAVDVHLRRAAAAVGVHGSDHELELLFSEAAAAEGLPLADVDGSLWQDGSDQSRRRRRRAT